MDTGIDFIIFYGNGKFAGQYELERRAVQVSCAVSSK